MSNFITEAIANGMQASRPQALMAGTIGDFAQYNTPAYIYHEFLMCAPRDTTRGLPCCELRTMSQCDGFTTCGNPKIDRPDNMLDSEYALIIQALSAGVIIQPRGGNG